MMVMSAAWVECGVAVGATGVGLEIGGNGELVTAPAAEDGWRVPLRWGPEFDRVVGQGSVAVFARIVGGAAFHFDGDDVSGAVVM